MRKTLLGLGIIAAMLVPTAAQAHVDVKSDAADSLSLFDISAAGMSHNSGFLWGGIWTHDAFRHPTLARAKNAFYVDFDTRGDNNADYWIRLAHRNGSLYGELYKYNQTGTRSYFWGAVKVSRVERGVMWRVSRDRLRIQGGFVRWYASTSYKSRFGACSEVCWDYAPRFGMYPHDLSR